MKTFFNVLYRRILYKIPLKLLLILLAVVAVFMACFSKAEMLVDETILTNFTLRDQHFYLSGYDIVCIKGLNCTNLGLSFDNWPNGYGVAFPNTNSVDNIYGICTNGTINYGNFGNSCIVYLYGIKYNNYTSLQCQTEYNLIPISSVDQSYCVSNNLCPASGGGDCPNVGVSNVFINDIFHPGAFNVIINIPEEIDWDYAYTSSGSNINIDIVGYNVDYTKVQDQIDIQNFNPSSEDLSSIITQVVPLFVPGLAIILLLYFIFRFIKKVF